MTLNVIDLVEVLLAEERLSVIQADTTERAAMISLQVGLKVAERFENKGRIRVRTEDASVA